MLRQETAAASRTSGGAGLSTSTGLGVSIVRTVYDRLAESLRLIEHGVPDEPVRLSRRRRFQPIAVDVDGDVAVTEFLCRVHGGAQWDSHVLARDGGGWRVLAGGSGCCFDYDELLQTPSCDTWRGHANSSGGGGSYWGGGRPGQQWIGHASVAVCEHVSAVVVGRPERPVTIPWHRRVAVVWPGHQAPPIALFDRMGVGLGTVTLGR